MLPPSAIARLLRLKTLTLRMWASFFDVFRWEALRSGWRGSWVFTQKATSMLC